MPIWSKVKRMEKWWTKVSTRSGRLKGRVPAYSARVNRKKGRVYCSTSTTKSSICVAVVSANVLMRRLMIKRAMPTIAWVARASSAALSHVLSVLLKYVWSRIFVIGSTKGMAFYQGVGEAGGTSEGVDRVT